jgi:hypothetical protein
MVGTLVVVVGRRTLVALGLCTFVVDSGVSVVDMGTLELGDQHLELGDQHLELGDQHLGLRGTLVWLVAPAGLEGVLSSEYEHPLPLAVLVVDRLLDVASNDGDVRRLTFYMICHLTSYNSIVSSCIYIIVI